MLGLSIHRVTMPANGGECDATVPRRNGNRWAARRRQELAMAIRELWNSPGVVMKVCVDSIDMHFSRAKAERATIISELCRCGTARTLRIRA